jgi:hypothetical protein
MSALLCLNLNAGSFEQIDLSVHCPPPQPSRNSQPEHAYIVQALSAAVQALPPVTTTHGNDLRQDRTLWDAITQRAAVVSADEVDLAASLAQAPPADHPMH